MSCFCHPARSAKNVDDGDPFVVPGLVVITLATFACEPIPPLRYGKTYLTDLTPSLDVSRLSLGLVDLSEPFFAPEHRTSDHASKSTSRLFGPRQRVNLSTIPTPLLSPDVFNARLINNGRRTTQRQRLLRASRLRRQHMEVGRLQARE